MKKLALFLPLVLVACLTKQQAVDVTKFTADVACAIENAELNDAEIADVCKLADDILDRVRPALAAHRRTLVRRGLTRGVTSCPDAGTQ